MQNLENANRNTLKIIQIENFNKDYFITKKYWENKKENSQKIHKLISKIRT